MPRVLFYLAPLFLTIPSVAVAQSTSHSQPKKEPVFSCPRGAEGGEINEPADRRSQNGVLKLQMAFRNSLGANGHVLYCYVDELGNQSPTLRLYPGDLLLLTLKNEITLPPESSIQSSSHPQDHLKKSSTSTSADGCAGGIMTSWMTNLHFHGMEVPPLCHQDDTLQTMLETTSAPFEYHIEIPKTQPPGLYWYHPHIHGFSEDQILGGASGALIVEGIERAKPTLAGLPERVLVIRDTKMPFASASQKLQANTPTKDISLNFTPIPYPKYPTPTIKLRPSERQFWRVLNASADTYIDLQLFIDGKRQAVSVEALDGIPIKYDEENSGEVFLSQTRIFLPPAGRAEFILTGPPAGAKGQLVTNAVSRGPSDEYNTRLPLGAISDARIASGQDDNDPSRPIATIIAAGDSPEPRSTLPTTTTVAAAQLLPPLASVRPLRTRKLFFSEELIDPKDPKSLTVFFITEEGQTPAAFDPKSTSPNIVVHQGDVEDWVVENRSQEPHAFHIHQTHFLPISLKGVPYEEPTLRDTINLPPWEGNGHPFPSVKLRMDFRDPAIIGTFPYHCHILQHVDAGMMGTIRVDPPSQK
jgi:FtsP/CotA-like multicopper oxidase with cupredoxin domain